jgi:hypothetical protein
VTEEEKLRRLAAYAYGATKDFPFRSDDPEDVEKAVAMGQAILKRARELFGDSLGKE